MHFSKEDIQITTTTKPGKDAQNHEQPGKWKSKAQWQYNFITYKDCYNHKHNKSVNVDVGKLESSCTTGGNVSGAVTLEYSWTISPKVLEIDHMAQQFYS